MSNNLPQLPDKDFIQDDQPKPNLPFWIWGVIFSVFVTLAWGIGSQLSNKREQVVDDSPFLKVTNRDFSIFLWQFPEHMRVNITQGRAGYLPGFQYTDKLSIEPGMAEQFVVAPPELLFLYHTWKRQVSPEFIINPIQLSEFKEFLLYAEEWQPKNWPNAPKDYVDFANTLLQNGDIQPGRLPDISPPKEVAQAFQGWQNFFKDGEAINSLSPLYGEVASFLSVAPHYARNYWRNVIHDKYPDYLKTYATGSFSPTVAVPRNELAPFLKFGVYNYEESLNK
jgi:hypothetical protein